MARSTQRVFVGDRQVVCLFCQNDRFGERAIKLNTTGLSFFNLEWANRAAYGLICSACGYIQMFMDPPIRHED